MFYIYIIYSKSADKYYIGHTNDVERRIIEHNSNPRMTYTHKFRPWDLVALFEVGENRKTAMKIEKFIKQQKSRSFILKIIISNELNGILAQLVTCLYSMVKTIIIC